MVMLLLLLLAFAGCTVGMVLRLLLCGWIEEVWQSACIPVIRELVLTVQSGLIGVLPWFLAAAGAVCCLLLELRES